MKILLWAGVVCVAAGVGSILWALWSSMQFSRSSGIGEVAGGMGPGVLLLLPGLLLLAAAGIVHVMRR
jgi:hypothetical protein